GGIRPEAESHEESVALLVGWWGVGGESMASVVHDVAYRELDVRGVTVCRGVLVQGPRGYGDSSPRLPGKDRPKRINDCHRYTPMSASCGGGSGPVAINCATTCRRRPILII